MMRGVSTEPTTALDDAEAALAGGEWERARAAFQRALADDANTVAEGGLARALRWLRDPDGGIVHMERAYAGFREAGDASKAARAAPGLRPPRQAAPREARAA